MVAPGDYERDDTMTHYTITLPTSGLRDHGIVPDGHLPYWVDGDKAIFGVEANSEGHARVAFESFLKGKGCKSEITRIAILDNKSPE